MTVDTLGNVYVSDQENNRVLQYNNPVESDRVADAVFGQFNFYDNYAATTNVSLNRPWGVTVDSQGNVYISDQNNNRVLRFDTPLSSDVVADRVYGQPDFSSSAPNNGGLTALSLRLPAGVTVDSQDNLYVADTANHRLLIYEASSMTDTVADQVLGQPSFTSNSINAGGVSARSLFNPTGVALDSQDNLYIADVGNHRVLKFAASAIQDGISEKVFGQPDFTTIEPNTRSVSAATLYLPTDLSVDSEGNLLVADMNNTRVLWYKLTQALPTPTTSIPLATRTTTVVVTPTIVGTDTPARPRPPNVVFLPTVKQK